MRQSGRWRLAAFAAAMVALVLGAVVAIPVNAQTTREITLIQKLGRQDAGPQLGRPEATGRKLSPDELMRLRMLEMQSGAIARARGEAESRKLVGPPLSEREKVIHVLNRLSFGATPGEVDRIVYEGGWKAWVMRQMAPEKIDDTELDTLLAERFPWTGMTLPRMKAAYPLAENGYNNPQLRHELPRAVLVRAALSKRQFKEVMCEFWRNHFCIDQPERLAPRRSWTACHYDDEVIRDHVFGKFEKMLRASAHHAGMLEYLDNHLSRKGAWNENYAREIMELHTLGVDSYYNEDDVLELTKVLTGWSFDDNLQFVFNAPYHEPGEKLLLGRRIAEGYGGGEYALHLLASHKGTAQFISWKLCRYLVNDNPPEGLVNRVAAVFRRSDGDLSKVYLEIIESPEFMRRENFRAKFRTPFECAAAALRATNADIRDAGATTAVVGRMGQDIYNCMDPTGYFDQAEAWMDAGVLTTRWDYSWKLVRGQVPGVSLPGDYFTAYENILRDRDKGGPAAMVDQMIKDIIGDDVGDRTREVMLEAAEQGSAPRAFSILLGSPSFQQQ